MPTPPKPILSYQQTPTTASGLGLSQSLGRSWAASPLAQESLQRDIDDASDDGYETASDDEWDDTPIAEDAPAAYEDYSLTGSYRRPSFAGARNQATLGPTLYKTVSNRERLPPEERQRIVSEERSLLRDNNLIPPKHPREDDAGRRGSVIERILSRQTTRPADTTPLLGDSSQPYGGYDEPGLIKQKWEEAVKEGKISTSWQRESKTLFEYSMPLMASFLLQYSIQIASIFTLGHIGPTELAAVRQTCFSAARSPLEQT